MASKETSLPPKIRKSWLKSGTETTPSADDNVDLTEHSWCPEVVEIMAKYGQTPADLDPLVVSDDEDEIEIHDTDGGDVVSLFQHMTLKTLISMPQKQ